MQVVRQLADENEFPEFGQRDQRMRLQLNELNRDSRNMP